MFKKIAGKLIIALAIAVFVPAAASTLRLKSLVFKGLDKISRFEIAEKSGFVSKDDFIIIDRGRLEDVLRAEPMIESYKIIIKNQTMTIIIKERESSYYVYVTGNRGSLIGLIDQHYNLISVNRIPRYADPLIILNNSDVDGRTLTSSVRKRIETFFAGAEKLSVKRQLKQVDMRDKSTVRVTLNGRPTVFVMGETREQLDRLEYLCGYFDSIGYYPPIIDISGDRAILR